MAFRNSLLLIAFFLVATTSVANCQLLPATPGLPGVPTAIVATANVINITNITTGVGVRTPLTVLNVTLNCSGVLIGLPSVAIGNGVIVILIPLPIATQINSSTCILSANVSIGGVTNIITSTLSSLVGLVPSALGLLYNVLTATLSALVVNGNIISVML